MTGPSAASQRNTGPAFADARWGDEGEERRIVPRPDVHLLRMDGVRFPNNKEKAFSRLERLTGKSAASTPKGGGSQG